MEKGLMAELRQGTFVTYCIVNLHLGRVEMKETPSGIALGFQRNMRMKLAGRTCVTLCLFQLEEHYGWALRAGLPGWPVRKWQG